MARAQPNSACDKPWNHFPDDVLMEAFLKLPVRSLLRFKTVSKHWCALIRSPSFIDLHLNRSICDHANRNPILIGSRFYTKSNRRKSVLTLISDEETLAYKDDVAVESLSPWIHSRGLWLKGQGCLLGPCNGLVCLTDMVDMVIFNPATRQHREVKRATRCFRDSYDDPVPLFHRVCFGFDSVSCDYKVIGFRSVDKGQFINRDDSGDICYKVDIYSLRTNTWTQVNRVAPARDMPFLFNHNCDLFFNGAFHWVGWRSRVLSSIVVFDLNKEDYRQLKLPDNFPISDCFPVYLSVSDECLRITVLSLSPDCETKIWVMKDYGVYNSWTKVLNITVVDTYSYNFYEPLWCSNDGEFFLRDIDKQLVSLNLNTREIKKLKVAFEGYPMFAFRYKESLVSF